VRQTDVQNTRGEPPGRGLNSLPHHMQVGGVVTALSALFARPPTGPMHDPFQNEKRHKHGSGRDQSISVAALKSR
jgi:hypothetical protein